LYPFFRIATAHDWRGFPEVKNLIKGAFCDLFF
jgi:hypothetical protein